SDPVAVSIEHLPAPPTNSEVSNSNSEVLNSNTPNLVRVIHAEPEETKDEEPLQRRVIYAEPEEETLPVSSIDEVPLQRVIYAEPEEETLPVSSIDEVPLQRVIYAEPEEETLPVLSIEVPLQRVIYAEPEEELPVLSIEVPLQRVIYAEPEEETLPVLPTDLEVAAPISRIIYAEPEEEEGLEVTMPPRVIYAEPEEEEFSPKERVIFNEPEDMDGVDSIPRVYVSSEDVIMPSPSSNSRPPLPLPSSPPAEKTVKATSLPENSISTEPQLFATPVLPGPDVPTKSQTAPPVIPLPESAATPAKLPPKTIIFPPRQQDTATIIGNLIQDLQKVTLYQSGLMDLHRFSVVLVEAWSWDTQNSGERQLPLFELTETDTILFSKGERVEVTLPYSLLPTINIKPSPSVTHKIVVKFTWHASASGPFENAVSEIPIRIAPFTRRDLDNLLIHPALLPAQIASILPPDFTERKQRELLRKESVETLRSQRELQLQRGFNRTGSGSSGTGYGSVGSISGVSGIGKKLFSLDTSSASVHSARDGPKSPPSFGVLSHTGPQELNRSGVARSLETLMQRATSPAPDRKSTDDVVRGGRFGKLVASLSFTKK
ncbi:hypothetical protein BDR26DRAFT_850623, partial [Obelidium mucronatum]